MGGKNPRHKNQSLQNKLATGLLSNSSLTPLLTGNALSEYSSQGSPLTLQFNLQKFISYNTLGKYLLLEMRYTCFEAEYIPQ